MSDIDLAALGATPDECASIAEIIRHVARLAIPTATSSEDHDAISFVRRLADEVERLAVETSP